MSTALQQARPGSLVPNELQWGMNRDQLDLVKRTIAKGVTDDEFALFMTVAQRRGLDPFDRQIHAVTRWDPDLERKVMTIQVGIDGYRLGATRTGEENGQDGPWWCGPDGAWVDVWLSTEAPVAAKVIAYRKGRDRGYVGIAHWASYVQTRKDGTPNAMWRKHGPGQLAKCAEALALRRAFPQELGGTHTEDELGEGAIDVEFKTVETATPVVQPRSLPAPSKPTIPTTAATTERAEPATVPAQHVDRKVSEEAAREEALAKARANAAEIDAARRDPAPSQGPTQAPTPHVLTDDDVDLLGADMLKATERSEIKAIAVYLEKCEKTDAQRAKLAKIYTVCDAKLRGGTAKGAA